jgi:rsbT co-antagonist protein RsbR
MPRMVSPAVDLPFLQAVLDRLDDPIFVKDRAHRWIAFNASFCALLGRSRSST